MTDEIDEAVRRRILDYAVLLRETAEEMPMQEAAQKLNMSPAIIAVAANLASEETPA